MIGVKFSWLQNKWTNGNDLGDKRKQNSGLQGKRKCPRNMGISTEIAGESSGVMDTSYWEGGFVGRTEEEEPWFKVCVRSG